MTDTDAKLIERLRKAADQAGIVLTDPPGPTPLKALLDEAAFRLSAVIAERDAWFAEAEDRANSCSIIARERDEAVALNVQNFGHTLVEANYVLRIAREKAEADLDEMRKALEPGLTH